MLHLARDSAVQVYADARWVRKALLVTAPAPLRDELRGLPWRRLALVCADLMIPKGASAEQRATLLALCSTGERLLGVEQQAGDLEREIRKLLDAIVPTLLAEAGVGPVAATQVLLAWSHLGRVRLEAAFAMLGGPRRCRPAPGGRCDIGSTEAATASYLPLKKSGCSSALTCWNSSG